MNSELTEKQQETYEGRKHLSKEIKEKEQAAFEKLQEFKEKQYKKSERYLEHYMGNSGSPMKLTSKEMEESKVLKNAMKENEKRFEDSLTKGYVDDEKRKKSPFKDVIVTMKDGETIDLQAPGVKQA